MSEEEKRAIEILKENRQINYKEADIVLNLVEKQQKEIEKLKQEIKDITSIPEGDEDYE